MVVAAGGERKEEGVGAGVSTRVLGPLWNKMAGERNKWREISRHPMVVF